eukprot:s1536_g5.t2
MDEVRRPRGSPSKLRCRLPKMLRQITGTQLDSGTQHSTRWLLLVVVWLARSASERVYRPADLLDADNGPSGGSCVVARPLNQTRGTVLYRGIALDYYHTRDQLSVSWQDASRIVEGRQDGITVWRFDPAYGWRNEFVELLWISLAGNGEQAAVQEEENAVQLWDISGDPRNWRGQALSGLEADLDFFSFVAWSPAGNHFAYCAQSEIKLWRRNSSGYWTSYQVLEADSLSWSSDEQQLATSEGNIVEVWDLGKEPVRKEAAFARDQRVCLDGFLT